MNNKTMIIGGFILLGIFVFGFTNVYQGAINPPLTLQERQDQKILFDQHQAAYNSKLNMQIRAQDSKEKYLKEQEQEQQSVDEQQDKNKGQILIKF